MIAYHWLKEDMHAGSGRERAWKVGEERTDFHKVIKLCEAGYHSSPSLFDGLQYAPGPIACLVEVSEPEARDATKQVSRTRKLLVAVNVEKELRQFAIDCAERVLTREQEHGREPDARSWAVLEAARAFIRGDINPEELATARDAARDAGWDAARAAALAAAWDAALAAALAAAWDAARDAARGAARDIEIAWQRQRFGELVKVTADA